MDYRELSKRLQDAQMSFEMSRLAAKWDLFNSTYVVPNELSCKLSLNNGINGFLNTIVYDIWKGFLFTLRDSDITFRADMELKEREMQKVLDFIHGEFVKPNVIKILSDNESVETWFETKDGKRLLLPRYFRNHIDLEHNVFYLGEYSEWIDKGIPTLNDLVRNGVLTECHDYKEETLQYKTYRYDISIKRAISYFKKRGYNVTEEAIKHNLEAYRRGYKSGYRDETNGYHLFTPSSFNPLSFNLTTLSTFCDWQTTYKC